MHDYQQLFFVLIDLLKEKGTHVTGAAREIGVKPVTVRSWRSRGKGAQKEHVEALIQAFPEQLKEKAEELGILTPALLSNEDRLAQLLHQAKKEIAELQYKINELEDRAEEERASYQRKIDTLLRAMEKLSDS